MVKRREGVVMQERDREPVFRESTEVESDWSFRSSVPKFRA